MEISREKTLNMEQLHGTTTLSTKTIERWGPVLVETVKRGLSLPEKDRPKLERSVRLNKKNTVMLERLNEFIQLKSNVQGIDPILIGNSSELKKLIKILNKSCKSQMVRQMEGWRKIFLNDFFRYAIHPS